MKKFKSIVLMAVLFSFFQSVDGYAVQEVVCQSEPNQKNEFENRIQNQIANDLIVLRAQKEHRELLQAEIDRLKAELEQLDTNLECCPVCLEPRYRCDQLFITQCNHIFCRNCVRSLAEYEFQDCPKCKAIEFAQGLVAFKYDLGRPDGCEVFSKSPPQVAPNPPEYRDESEQVFWVPCFGMHLLPEDGNGYLS